MSVGNKTAAVVGALLLILLLLLFGVQSVATDSSSRGGLDAGARTAVGDNAAAPATDRADRRAKAPAAAVEPHGLPLPEPVNLDLVDRELDLHGVVVRRDGTPIGGAEIVAVLHPSRTTDFLVSAANTTAIDGPKTRSALDGTFALRLRRGARAQLRVTAAGFPVTTIRERQAGERVRIVLDAGVRLRVSVVDGGGSAVPGVKVHVVTGWAARVDDVCVDQTVVTGSDGDAMVVGLPAGARVSATADSDQFAFGGGAEVLLGDSGETSVRLVLTRGRVIGGSVVDDATGAPIAGARIGVGFWLNGAVVSDESGRFRASGWRHVGDTEIDAVASGYARGSTRTAGEAEIEIRLRRGFRASGRIVDGGGRPIAHAFVGLVASVREAEQQRMSSGDSVTADDGRFHIADLNPDLSHVLIVVAEGFGRLRRPVPRSESGPLDLGDIVLAPSQFVSGHVFNSDGTSAAHVPVVLVGPRLPPGTDIDEVYYGREQEVVTDDRGRFVFSDLATGEYEIVATVAGASDVSASVVVPVAGDVEGLRLTAERGRKIAIHLVDEAGEPVRGIRIRVMVPNDGYPLNAYTGDDGVARFEAPDLPAQYWIDSDDPRCTVYDVNVVHNVPPDGKVELVLYDNVPLAGIVVDAGGLPVSRAVLRLVTVGLPDERAIAGKDGRFTALARKGVPVRIEFVGVSADAGAASDESNGLVGTVECVPPAQNVVVQCTRVRTDRTLIVKVISPDGSPFQGASVLAADLRGRTLSGGVTDDRGVAKLEGLPERAVLVSVRGAESWATPRRLSVTPRDQEIVMALRHTIEIRGCVMDANGNPAEAYVSASAGEEEVASASSGADGVFVLRVPTDVAGPFRLDASGKTATQPEGAVDSVAPGTAGVRIVLSR